VERTIPIVLKKLFHFYWVMCLCIPDMDWAWGAIVWLPNSPYQISMFLFVGFLKEEVNATEVRDCDDLIGRTEMAAAEIRNLRMQLFIDRGSVRPCCEVCVNVLIK
jgi:hypothetical protein